MPSQLKITLAILLLTISNLLLAQTKKGDMVVSPQLYFTEYTNSSTSRHFNFGVSTSMHYFLCKEIGIGLVLSQDFDYYKPKLVNQYKSNNIRLQLLPEIQYNILSKQITPFIRLQPFDYNLYLHRHTTDNPAVPKKQRTINTLTIVRGDFFNFRTGIGLNYTINKVAAAYGVINFYGSNRRIGFGNFALGLQFSIKNKR